MKTATKIAILLIAILITVFVLNELPHFGKYSTSGLEPYTNEACEKLVEQGCTEDTSNIITDNFNGDKDDELDPGTTWDWNNPGEPSEDNLAALCYNWYSITTEAGCKEMCGC